MPVSSTRDLSAATPATLELIGAMASETQSWVFSVTDGRQISWSAKRYSGSGSIALSYGEPVLIVQDVKDQSLVADGAMKFALGILDDLGLKGCDLRLSGIDRVLEKITVVSLEPVIDGVRVFDGYIILSLNIRGELTLLKARGFGSGISGSFALSGKTAITRARKASGISRGPASHEKIYLPVRNSQGELVLRCAYRIVLDGPDPAFQPVIFVDAATGEISAAENRVCTIEFSGVTHGLYHPLYGRDDEEDGPFRMEWIEVAGDNRVTSGEDGEFAFEVDEDDLPVTVASSLSGDWVDVQVLDEDGQNYNPQASFEIEVDADEEPIDIHWNEDNAREDERTLYASVNRIHDYWKSIEPDSERMDYPILAVCNVFGGGMEDNAFSSGIGIFFGRGNQCDNFALYADVVYHEYTHTVTGRVYGNHALPYVGESGALNEAWSDYFPCSFTDESLLGEGGLVGNGWLRNIDNNLLYPRDIRNEVHADSRIISAAMWHTREELGADYSDSLFHFARFGFAQDFSSYLADVFVADDDDGDLTDGTPNYRAIYDGFFRHGIQVIDMPVFRIRELTLTDDDQNGADGNDNGIFEPGEIIRVDVSVFHAGRLVEDDVDDAVINLSTDHPGIRILENDIVISAVDLGEWARSTDPLLFEVTDDVELSFAELYFAVGPEGGALEIQDTLRIALGLPALLLVRDGNEGTDQTTWYEQSLDELGLVYSEYSTISGRYELGSVLPVYETLIWYSGDARNDLLSEESRTLLEEFLESGGRLLLTGQDFGSDPDAGVFFAEYLGTVNTIDSVRGMNALGVAGDPVSDSLEIFLIGGEGPRNQSRPGAVEAIEPAVEILHWNRVLNEPAAGVRCADPETGAKTVYLPFGIEAVSGAGGSITRTGFISRILDWLEHDQAVEYPGFIPLAFSLADPFPNPFNSRILVPFTLSGSGIVHLWVFDVSGRLVESGERMFGSGENTWSLKFSNYSAGTYLLRIEHDENTATTRIHLVR